jgi:hypothetical protein
MSQTLEETARIWRNRAKNLSIYMHNPENPILNRVKSQILLEKIEQRMDLIGIIHGASWGRTDITARKN